MSKFIAPFDLLTILTLRNAVHGVSSELDQSNPKFLLAPYTPPGTPAIAPKRNFRPVFGVMTTWKKYTMLGSYVGGMDEDYFAFGKAFMHTFPYGISSTQDCVDFIDGELAKQGVAPDMVFNFLVALAASLSFESRFEESIKGLYIFCLTIGESVEEYLAAFSAVAKLNITIDDITAMAEDVRASGETIDACVMRCVAKLTTLGKSLDDMATNPSVIDLVPFLKAAVARASSSTC